MRAHVAAIVRRTIFLMAAAVSGCAILPSPNNTAYRQSYTGTLDFPALFGSPVSKVKLADGNTATLRVYKGAYSLKVEAYSRVVDIPDATSARIERTEFFGKKSVMVVQTANQRSPNTYLIYAIEGNQVKKWSLPDRDKPPVISVRGDNLFFDYERAKDIQRYTYYDGKLYPARSLPKSVAAASAKTAGTAKAPSPGTAAPPSAQAKPQTSRKQETVDAADLPGNLDFGGQTPIKPVTIDLEQ